MATDNTLFVAMPFEQFQQLLIQLIRTELENIVKHVIIQDDKLMMIEEVEAMLQVSKVTIHDWVKKELIHSYRIGRRIYFKKAELISSMEKSNFKPKRKI